MLRECLEVLSNTKVDIGDRKKQIIKNFINYYDDEQLSIIMRTPKGLIIDDVNIFYFPNVGFRCSNDVSKTGRLPICNIIQRILNDELTKY
jgi:hypothetical protein